MSDFKLGDVVRLKCGGVPMTINEIGPERSEQRIETVWFEGSVLHRDNFEPDALEIAQKAFQ